MPTDATTTDDATARAAAAAAAEAAVNRAQGNAMRALRHTVREAEQLRARVSELETHLAAARKLAPAEGGVVLTADEAKLWAGFKELDATPEAVQTALDKYESLLAASEARDLAEMLRAAAVDLGWNPGALPRIVKAEGLDAELRDVVITADDGTRTTEKLLHVRKADDDKAPWELIDVYITRDAADWLPSLESVPRDSADDGDAGGGDSEDDDLDGTGTLQGENMRNAASGRRRSAYRAAGAHANGTNGGNGKGADGVRFPAQRNPTPRSRITRAEMERLAVEKNRNGEYNSF